MTYRLSKAITCLETAKKFIDEAEAIFKAEGIKTVHITNEDFNDQKEIEVQLLNGIEVVADGKELQNRPPCYKGSMEWEDYNWVKIEGVNFIQKKREP